MGLLEYMFGPRIYKDYYINIDFNEMYKLPKTERLGDFIINILNFLWKTSIYISPILAIILYKQTNNFRDAMLSLFKIGSGLAGIAVIGMCLRVYGRLSSTSYRRLVEALKMAKSPQTAEEGRKALKMFDFDFQWWPVDFDVGAIENNETDQPIKVLLHPIKQKFGVKETPQYIISYILMHSFGIRMIYPGSIKLITRYLRSNLVAGRAKLILRRGAKRFKLRTADGNKIDTAFVDNRKKGKNGEILIISSEGNLSFYEIGVGSTSVGREFSVLGWNHPGFEGSTGNPYPEQEMNAVDAVIKFAINELDFNLSDIILYGWSIGGFSAACGASKYGGVKGVILDGTFDDVLELAIARFPNILARLVEIAVRFHCNLNNIELLKKYNGPVLMVRRTYDETITLGNRIETNRGNFLAIKLLQYRFPNIFQKAQIELIEEILSKPLKRHSNIQEQEIELTNCLVRHVKKYGKIFPLSIGDDFSDEQRNQVARFLLGKHVIDYKSSHCTRLPLDFFQIPWDIPLKEQKK